MNKNEIADIFDDIAVLLELKGENTFKVRAYENAARSVRAIPADLDEFLQEHQLSEIKGIGKALAEKITSLHTTGKLEYYDRLKSSIPPGLVEMTRIPNLGPKRIKIINEKLGIDTVAGLEEACQSGVIAELEGFGEKSQEKILEGIEALKKYTARHLFPVAEAAAQLIFDHLKDVKQIKRLSWAGSLRRKRETIGDLDFVASTSDSKAVMHAFTSFEGVQSVIAHGETKSTVSLASGIHADLRTVSDTEFPYTLHHLSGSKEHNIAMRSRALKMRMKINEYGLFKGEKLIKAKDEEEFFRKLGLDYIEPELREDMGEIEAAENGRLPRLIEDKDLRGIIHVHTTYSDGSNTLAEVAEAAKAMGYEYIGIADHSQSVTYAGGLKPEDVERQFDEIDKLNGRMKPFRILKGTEVDILPNGKLDYDDKLLKQFDFVIIAVHSRFNMTESEMTERIIKALTNKYVTMLSHPTGRLLLEREPYPVNMHAVIDAASEHGKTMEINAHPSRLDLDWRMCKYAKEKGVKASINPDAHNIGGMVMRYGVGITRKGWLEKEDVINTLPLGSLQELLVGTQSGV